MTPTEASDLVVRPADRADVAEMARIHVEARRAADMPDAVHPVEVVRDWLAGRLHGDEAWVVEDGTGTIGYARFGAEWLDDLYVTPRAWGSGAGSLLLDVVKARRPGGFSLWVFVSNARARRFYARHGLVELEHTDGSENPERSPDIRVEWPGQRPAERSHPLP